MQNRKSQWRSQRTRSKFDLAKGKVDRCIAGPTHGKGFEDMTVGELREMAEQQVAPNGPPHYVHTREPDANESCWVDQAEEVDLECNVCYEDEEDKPAEILGFTWRSDAADWDNKKLVRVESVVDSGVSAPVAPPSMLPNVKIEESEGSRRGQKYISASTHKLNE